VTVRAIHEAHLSRTGGQPLRMLDLVDVLYRLTRGPMSCESLAAQFNLKCDTGRVLLRRFHSLGWVRICAWSLSPHGRGPYLPEYEFANGQPDVPKPESYQRPGRKERKPRTTRVTPGRQMLMVHRMLSALKSGSLTAAELAEEVGVNENTARSFLNHARGRLVFVAAWGGRRLMPGGAPIALWQFGVDRRNAPRPKTQTNHQRHLKRRERTRSLLEQSLLNHVMAGTAASNGHLFKRLASSSPQA
jgi:hypothetical protein